MTALYLLPLAVTILLLATRRAGLLSAGAVGLLLTLVLAPLALPEGAPPVVTLARQALAGAWLAWQAIAVILAGFFFHAVVTRTNPELFAVSSVSEGQYDPRKLFTAAFLLGPFFEAATGFGVGLVIVIPFLLRIGVGGVAAIAFGLYSQIFVPWGAMAIGSTVGAGLAGLPPEELGVASALLMVPLTAGHLSVFWWLQSRCLSRPSRRQMLDDLLWVGMLLALLFLANRFIALEAGALAACGLLLLARLPRDAGGFPRQGKDRSKALRAAAPYAALTVLVLLTRAVPPLRAELSALLALRPFAELPAFPLFYHVAVLILAVAIATGLACGLAGRAWRAALSEGFAKARTPVLVTLAFVVMGQVTAESGMAAAMMGELTAFAGSAAVLASPLPAALAGFLTGSNVAANAILMPLQANLAATAGHSLTWVAAIQNVAGSTFTLLSPIRVAMGTALLAIPGREGAVYRLILPLGAVSLALLVLAAGVLLLT